MNESTWEITSAMGRKSKAKAPLGLSSEDRSLWQRVVDSLEPKARQKPARTKHSTAPLMDEQTMDEYALIEDEAYSLEEVAMAEQSKAPVKAKGIAQQSSQLNQPSALTAVSPDFEQLSDEHLWGEFTSTLDHQKTTNTRKKPPKPTPLIARVAVSQPAVSSNKPRYKNPFQHHPLEDKIAKKLAKKRMSIDGQIDLHGMTQEQAYHSLLRYLQNAQRNNNSIILVITGKGVQGQGVLRQMVPQWLQNEPFLELTNGFRHAHVYHGGTGALYVRIRKYKGGR
jgi:DNA-nicking Smr family endonuclease